MTTTDPEPKGTGALLPWCLLLLAVALAASMIWLYVVVTPRIAAIDAFKARRAERIGAAYRDLHTKLERFDRSWRDRHTRGLLRQISIVTTFKEPFQIRAISTFWPGWVEVCALVALAVCIRLGRRVLGTIVVAVAASGLVCSAFALPRFASGTEDLLMWPPGTGYTTRVFRPDAEHAIRPTRSMVVIDVAGNETGYRMNGDLEEREAYREPLTAFPGATITHAAQANRRITLRDYNENDCALAYGITVKVDEYGEFVPIRYRPQCTPEDLFLQTTGRSRTPKPRLISQASADGKPDSATLPAVHASVADASPPPASRPTTTHTATGHRVAVTIAIGGKDQYKGYVIGKVYVVRMTVRNLTGVRYRIGPDFRVLMTLNETESYQFAMAASGPVSLAASLNDFTYGSGASTICKREDDKKNVVIAVGSTAIQMSSAMFLEAGSAVTHASPKGDGMTLDQWWPEHLPPRGSVTIRWPVFWYNDPDDKPHAVATPSLTARAEGFYCWVNVHNNETREIPATPEALRELLADPSAPVGLRCAAVRWLLECDIRKADWLLPHVQQKGTPQPLARRSMQALMVWGGEGLVDHVFWLWRERRLLPVLRKQARDFFSWSSQPKAKVAIQVIKQEEQ